jgi:hypothetical protein
MFTQIRGVIAPTTVGFVLQWNHWTACVVGFEIQVQVETVTLFGTRSVPVIFGATVLAGTATTTVADVGAATAPPTGVSNLARTPKSPNIVPAMDSLGCFPTSHERFPAIGRAPALPKKVCTTHFLSRILV